MEIIHNSGITTINKEDDEDCRQNDRSHYLSHNKRIYIFEDIDAMSDIVHDREKIQTPAYNAQKPITDRDILRDTVKELITVRKQGNDDNAEKILMDPEAITDPLTLSGILNCLDGVVELHGSILILTTNHVEKLDPALIRPGRMNISLHLDRMEVQCLAQMLSFFYDIPVTEDTLRSRGFKDLERTPAQYEQILMMSPTIEDFYMNFGKS